MNRVRTLPNQRSKIFKDRFERWPQLFKLLVFCSYFFPVFIEILPYYSNWQPPSQFLFPTIFIIASVLIIFFGIKINQAAKRVWHKNYRITFAIQLAFVPLLILGVQIYSY